MLESLTLALKDFFDRKVLLTSLIPIVVAAIFWGIVFFVFHAPISAMLTWLLSHIPFMSAEWIRDTVEAIGGILIYYELLIITSVMIVGIIADRVVDQINNKYYHLAKNGFGSLTGSIMTSFKFNLIFIVLFIILLPAMFVPGLNILVHLFLWMILIKEPLFYDSIAMYADRNNYLQLKKNHRMQIFVLTLVAACLFFIPIIGIFVYVLQLMIFAHFNLKQLKALS